MTLPYQEVLQTLSGNPTLIRSLASEFPPELVKRRPAVGVWSAHEHFCHLAEVHSLFFSRLDQMLSEQNPLIKPYFPDQEMEDGELLERDLDTELGRFVSDREAIVERLRELSPEQWLRTGRHEEYSRYSVFIMFRHLALHDLDHAYEIEALLLSRVWE